MHADLSSALLGLRAAAGLEQESEAETLARLTVEPMGTRGLLIKMASDGLSLVQKLTIERGLKSVLPTQKVEVRFKREKQLPDTPAHNGPAPLPEKTSPFGLKISKRASPGVTEVIVVASGKGGVGKSTVSVNLAVALAASGARVGILDADIYGPSVPLMLGLAGQMPVTEGDKLMPLMAHGVKAVSFGFLTDTEQPVIWRGPLVSKAFQQLCYDVNWGELDYLVIDLPPGTGDIQLALIETLPVHAALIVTTPQNVALLDAHKALTMFEKLDVPVLGLVENMSEFVCQNCGHHEPIFASGGGDLMAKTRNLPLLAHVPLAAPVRAGGDCGQPVALSDGALGEPFRKLAAIVRRGAVRG